MIIWFQPPRYVQGRQPAGQAAQSHIQLEALSSSAALTPASSTLLQLQAVCAGDVLWQHACKSLFPWVFPRCVTLILRELSKSDLLPSWGHGCAEPEGSALSWAAVGL